MYLEQVCAGLQQFHSNEVMTQVIPVHQDPVGSQYFHLLSPETTRITESTIKATSKPILCCIVLCV